MARLFDSSNPDYLEIADNAALSLPDGDWAIAFWTRITDGNAGSGQRWYYNHGGHGGVNAVSIFGGEVDNGFPNRVQWYVKGATEDLQDFSADQAFGQSSAWQHILLQREGNDGILYINGVADANTDTNANMEAVNPTTVAHIGSTWNSLNAIDGDIAEFVIWGDSLDAAERASLAAGALATDVKANPQIYIRILGNNDPEPDLVGSNSASVSGTTKSDHPFANDFWVQPPTTRESRVFSTRVRSLGVRSGHIVSKEPVEDYD
jgi:hypothetical protein